MVITSDDFERFVDDLKLETPKDFENLKESKEEIRNSVKKINNERKPKFNQNNKILTRRGQIEAFWEIQPFYYDRSKIFWLWDKEEFKWVMSDEIDFCNSIHKELGINTIDSKIRSETIEAFKEVGREHKPKEINRSWVQFKEKIYDIKTGEIFDATPEYFVSNPIPWSVGETEDTPTIDKLFCEWMEGQDNGWIDTLNEVLAYSICPDKFMQRIIAFCGGGSNGKGTFIKLMYRFLGENNHVASELKNLSEDKFEPAVLYKKLLCVMGEVNYDDLKNTNFLKKVAGEDKLSFQFKGKTPFTEDNTATCICLTNSMPITPDKSTGFYRKWLIIEFPNQFEGVNIDLIGNIPDIEFNNLAKKCLRILKELYENPQFTNEGDFDERARRYEEKSNPIIKFVEEMCEETPGKMVTLREFTNKCNEYLKSKFLRVMTSKQVGKTLRNEGFAVGNRTFEGAGAVVVLNIELKNIKNIKNIQNQTSFLRKKSNTEMDIFNINNINSYKFIENCKFLDTTNIERTYNIGDVVTKNDLDEQIIDILLQDNKLQEVKS